MSQTAEEELESAVWQAMHLCRVTCPDPVRFIELVGFAAQRYAAGDSPVLTALRREILHENSGPQGQAAASGCGGDGGAAHEPNASRSTAAGRLPTAVGGATLSTGPDIPAASKIQAKSHPQDADNA